MSEDASPLIVFRTRENTELGAQGVELDERDGSIVFRGVVKQITESMLGSYPRDQLGKWTPNRAAVRYDREEVARRDVRRADTGEELDVEGVLALAG